MRPRASWAARVIGLVRQRNFYNVTQPLMLPHDSHPLGPDSSIYHRWAAAEFGKPRPSENYAARPRAALKPPPPRAFELGSGEAAAITVKRGWLRASISNRMGGRRLRCRPAHRPTFVPIEARRKAAEESGEAWWLFSPRRKAAYIHRPGHFHQRRDDLRLKYSQGAAAVTVDPPRMKLIAVLHCFLELTPHRARRAGIGGELAQSAGGNNRRRWAKSSSASGLGSVPCFGLPWRRMCSTMYFHSAPRGRPVGRFCPNLRTRIV